jgi:alpha-glucoside transport system substrate-binding protein
MTTRYPPRRNIRTGIALIGLLAASIGGTATQAQSPATDAAGSLPPDSIARAEASGLDLDLYAAAVANAREIAGDEQLAPTLEYVGGNTGAEGEAFQAVYQAFTDATGTAIDYGGTGSSVSTNVTIQSRVQAGNPPDLADMTLGVAKSFAQAGDTLDLTATIGADVLAANFGQSLLDSLSYDGKVFGVPQGFSTFMVWYNPKTYTGPTAPQTWQEVVDWTNTAAAAGQTPWCIAEEAGAGSGFPGTQWIESLFGKMYGPEMLAKWSSGELPWTSDEVKSAWEAFGSIATDDSKVAGGVAGSLSESIATGSNGLIADPPTCQAVLWGSWVPGLIGEGVIPGENLDFYQIPGDVPEFASTEIFNAGSTVVLKDSPTAQAFIRFLASGPTQALLGSANRWMVANTTVPSSTYKSPLVQKAAATYFGGDADLVAPPDIMSSAAVGAAFNKGVVSFLQDPSRLDEILQGIQDAAEGN